MHGQWVYWHVDPVAEGMWSIQNADMSTNMNRNFPSVGQNLNIFLRRNVTWLPVIRLHYLHSSWESQNSLLMISLWTGLWHFCQLNIGLRACPVYMTNLFIDCNLVAKFFKDNWLYDILDFTKEVVQVVYPGKAVIWQNQWKIRSSSARACRRMPRNSTRLISFIGLGKKCLLRTRYENWLAPAAFN